MPSATSKTSTSTTTSQVKSGPKSNSTSQATSTSKSVATPPPINKKRSDSAVIDLVKKWKGPKKVPHKTSYDELCPNCRVFVPTRADYRIGNCAMVTLLLGMFLFFPLFFFCCKKSVRDVEHRCPYCRTHLSTNKKY